MRRKIVCKECGWKGEANQLLTGNNPFAPDEIVFGCPECKSVDCHRPACDTENCWSCVTCGIMTPDGYRSTCSRHMPEFAKEKGVSDGSM